ncbi:hypothetical protein D3C78_834600 [compost metagenome]
MGVHLRYVITLTSLEENGRSARQIPLINSYFHCATIRHILLRLQVKTGIISDG